MDDKLFFDCLSPAFTVIHLIYFSGGFFYRSFFSSFSFLIFFSSFFSFDHVCCIWKRGFLNLNMEILDSANVAITILWQYELLQMVAIAVIIILDILKKSKQKT